MYQALLVDDEPPVRRRLRKLVEWEKLGFIITGEAEDGEDGLALARELKPDLLILDVRMPIRTGLEVADILSVEQPNTRCIILTGYGEFDLVRSALRSGVIDYLLKPVDEQTLTNALVNAREQLGRQKMLTERLKVASRLAENETPEGGISLSDRIKRYIQEHYAEDISLRGLSRVLYMNPAYMGQRFAQEAGMSFNAYLLNHRIDRAKALLLDPKLNVTDIADAVGFPAPANFYRAFKKVEGCSPNEYRARLNPAARKETISKQQKKERQE